MEIHHEQQNAEQNPSRHLPNLSVKRRILIIVLILALGVGIAVFLKKTAPVASRQAPVKQAQLVEVQTARVTAVQPRITAYGQVVAARSLTLKSQVAGQVVEVNPAFDVGVCLLADTPVVQIDPQDYRLARASRQAALASAQAALDLELGQQEVARAEWQLYQDSGAPLPASPARALREPYLQQARAAVEAAQVELAQAELDLQRTRVVLPFDALVLSKNVERGAQLASQGEVATLAAIDAFWVEVAVPLDQLSWLDVPDVNSRQGAQALVHSPATIRPRQGQVIRLLGELEQEGRMARLLVEIPDPLDRTLPTGQRQPLLLGDYVEVNLLARPLDKVITLPWAVVHEGQQVWVASGDKLEIRPVHVVWKNREQVFIDQGLNEGDQVIMSNLSTPVAGMAIRYGQAADAETETHQ